MAVSMETTAGMPGLFREDGYVIPDGLPFERWCEVMDTLQSIERSVKWWVGDALVYGEATYGEKASQAFPDAFSGSPYAEATLRAAAWVSERFPRGTRVDGVTWTHHRVVAEMPRHEATALLEEAARINNDPETDEYVSSRALIEKAKVVKERLRGRVVAVTGDVLDAPELPLTVDDLTAEARAPLNVRLAEMGARMRPGFAAGWVQALVWAGHDDAFNRD